MDMIGIIEKELGREAIKNFMPMQPGDIAESYADIEYSEKKLGYKPTTPISAGIPRFIDWFKEYHGK